MSNAPAPAPAPATFGAVAGGTRRGRSVQSADAARGRCGLPSLAAAACGVVLGLFNAAVHAQVLLDQPPEPARDIGVDERLGERIPLDISFLSAEGTPATLRSYFNDNNKPVVLALVYYDCPVVCPMVLDRLLKAFNEMDYVVGEDFNVVVASFDFTEGVTESSTKKALYTSSYEHASAAEVADDWAFLTGTPAEISRLADAVGFRFNRLDNGEYAHPMAVTVLSPDGMVSRYFYGVQYDADQFRLALLEASEGKIAKSVGDVMAFMCYRWNPSAGAYTMEAMAVMRVAGVLTIAGLALFLGLMFAGERARRVVVASRRRGRAAPEPPQPPQPTVVIT